MKRFLAAGAAVGVAGVGIFGLVHALIIVPIWDRLLGGIPFGVGAGLVMGWAFSELHAAGRWRATPAAGLVFGLLMWATLIPMTAFEGFLRATGIHGTDNIWEIIVACLLAFVTGGLSGGLIGRRWRPALAVGAASLGLALAMGGPIPVTNNARAAKLFAAFAGVYAFGGLALVLLASAVARPSRSPAARRFLLVAAIYCALWLLTAIAGRPQLLQVVTSELGPRWQLETRAPAPFVVSVRGGWATSTPVPAGQVTRRLYPWVPGWRILVYRKDAPALD